MPDRFKRRLRMQRASITTLVRDMRRLRLEMAERDHNFAARVHQFSNMLMGFEQRLYEIAEYIDQTLTQQSNTDASSAQQHDNDDKSLHN